jgi:hypothetical protein
MRADDSFCVARSAVLGISDDSSASKLTVNHDGVHVVPSLDGAWSKAPHVRNRVHGGHPLTDEVAGEQGACASKPTSAMDGDFLPFSNRPFDRRHASVQLLRRRRCEVLDW